MGLSKRQYNQAGAAHLILVGIIVVVIIGVLGFVAYNSFRGAGVNAGGFSFLGFGGAKNTATEQLEPAALTATFKPTDWSRSKSARVVKDVKLGQVLQINKVGVNADKAALASLSADDKRLKELNAFHASVLANATKNKKNYYNSWVCLSYKRTYTNQDIKKFPYVSTFQASVGPYQIGGSVYDTVWHTKECKHTKVTPRLTSGGRSLQDSAKSGQKYLQADVIYKNGFAITTKTTLPDKKSANPPANGVITISDLTITFTLDNNYKP